VIEITNQILDQMVDAIVSHVHAERIILFGSHADGTAGKESDIDLLIEESEPFVAGRTRWSEIRKIRRALSKFRIAKDVLVYSTDEVAKWRDSRNHIVSRCLRDGRVLYERS